MITKTHATRILDALSTATTNGLSNRSLADTLGVPVDSVRRTINTLRAQGRVVRNTIYNTNHPVRFASIY